MSLLEHKKIITNEYNKLIEGLDKGDLEGRRKRMATVHTKLQEMDKTLIDSQVACKLAKR